MENDKLVRMRAVHDAIDNLDWVDGGGGKIYVRQTELVDAINSIPAVDYVPMDFHNRCMQVEIQKRLDLERFVKWVMDEIFTGDWEYNRIAFDELACRKLVKMGYVEVDEENDLYYRKDEPEDG